VSTHAEEMAEGWQRVHPFAVLVTGLRNIRQAIFPIVIVLFGSQSIGGMRAGVVLGILLLILLFNVGGAWLAWRKLRYLVGESDVRLEQGILSRQARSVPHDRIQDVSLEQGLLPRLFGLVEVRFETGAGGKDELKLAYVTQEEGERLREVVRDQKEAPAAMPATTAQGAEEQVAAQQPPAQLLFAMPPGRLLTFGLFQFSLVIVALIGAALQQVEFLLPFDIWDIDGWEKRLSGPGQWLSGLGWLSQIIGALSGVLFLIVLGVLTGIGRTFLRDWDFRLEKTAKGFRRRRGLLTKTDVVMPAHRVQAVTMGAGLVRRIWGWHSLSFISLAQDAKSANHDVAPFAQVREIEPIVREANFHLPAPDTDWHRPSPKYRFDTALLGAIPVALVGIVCLFFAEVYWLGWLLFAFAAFEALRQHFLWRYERHAVDATQIITRRGWLVPRTTMANRVKLHSVEISQGLIAKRRGYCHLVFGLAGGSFAFNGLPLEEAEAMRAAVLDSIASVDFAHLPR